MWTLILITLAAIFKAIADTLDDHFDTSVFRSKNPLVWDANHSTVRKWWITNYKPDPWHICNSLLIVCFSAAIIVNDTDYFNVPWWADLIGIGLVFNLVFEVFYSKWLRKK
jgi:hypothetical protein